MFVSKEKRCKLKVKKDLKPERSGHQASICFLTNKSTLHGRTVLIDHLCGLVTSSLPLLCFDVWNFLLYFNYALGTLTTSSTKFFPF